MINSSDAKFRKMAVLHILTLTGSKGEYGGPTAVARQTCSSLRDRGHSVQIFSGILKSSVPSGEQNFIESYEFVRPLIPYFPVSTLFSINLPYRLFKIIKSQDVVHIHFARDLMSILSSIICIFLKVPYFTQTHGMVVPDKRLVARLYDSILTRHLLSSSIANFALTEKEIDQLRLIAPRSKQVLLNNGVRIQDKLPDKKNNNDFQVIFCSRLESRKRPDRFLRLAKHSYNIGINAKFRIYGPDAGELRLVLNSLKRDSDLSKVTYEGALFPNQVPAILTNSDLLVLPSEDEPYPMVVIEALSLGTPTLIMPSCGLADLIKQSFPYLVPPTEEDLDILSAFIKIIQMHDSPIFRRQYQQFARQNFDILDIANRLESYYLKAVTNNG